MAAASQFNGFKKPRIHYMCHNSLLESEPVIVVGSPLSPVSDNNSDKSNISNNNCVRYARLQPKFSLFDFIEIGFKYVFLKFSNNSKHPKTSE